MFILRANSLSFDSVPNNGRKTRSYQEVYKHNVRRQTDMRPQTKLPRMEMQGKTRKKVSPGKIRVKKGNRLLCTITIKLQSKISVPCYENISTNQIFWLASFGSPFGGYVFLKKFHDRQLTQATTLPLKQGKFISSSLISSLTTLQ